LIHYGSNKAAIHHSGDLQSVVARMPHKPKPAGADAFATPPRHRRTPAAPLLKPAAGPVLAEMTCARLHLLEKRCRDFWRDNHVYYCQQLE
jgi:hypothetical protein